MAGNDYQVPDLVSVLRTLASFAPQGQQPQVVVSPAIPQSSGINEKLQPEVSSVKPPSVPAPKLIDPATIIDWSSGLRCVMKTVAAQDNIIKEIRRMIKVQQEHEEQWWSGRQALLKRQEARIEGQKKLDEVLRAVGGAVTERNENPAEELKTFDMKVHRAQVQMVKEMSARLKSFGVPFFGTRSELVLRKGEIVTEGKTISEGDLVELQRKMIGMLEDLCNE